MNNCFIELRGEVRKLMRFLTDNVSFAYADDKGIHFTTDILFGNIVKEMDGDAMKELYGVPVSAPVKFMTIEINKNEPDYFEEYYDEADEDDRPRDLYKFTIHNYSSNNGMSRDGFSIENCFNKGVYFKPCTYVPDRKEFIDNFFKEFSNLHEYCKEDVKKLEDWGIIEFEVPVYDVPVEITEAWRREYELSTSVVYSDENRIVEYYMFPQSEKEVDLKETRPEGEDMLKYTNILLKHNWANVHLMLDNLCGMLYEMKDILPFDIDLEPTNQAFNKYKYNKFYGDISNLVYSLSKNDKPQLAKIYVAIGNMYDKLIGKNKEA